MRDFSQLTKKTTNQDISERDIYEQRKTLFEMELLHWSKQDHKAGKTDEELKLHKKLRRIYRLNPPK